MRWINLLFLLSYVNRLVVVRKVRMLVVMMFSWRIIAFMVVFWGTLRVIAVSRTSMRTSRMFLRCVSVRLWLRVL